MKCFKCKNKIKVSVRHCMDDNRFHDLCRACYKKVMKENGYVLKDGIWRKK